MTNRTEELDTNLAIDRNFDRTDSTSARKRHHPTRWAIAVLLLAITALGGLKATEHSASAAAGSTNVTICWVDQYGKVANATVSSQYYNSGNPKTWATAKTNRNGCATVKTPTGSMVRFTIHQATGSCPSWHCYVTSGWVGWYSTKGVKAGTTHHIGTARVNTILINNGYQATQSVINGMR